MTPEPGPAQYLRLAKEHKERVLQSSNPPRWIFLSTFGFYALEAAVMAAAHHLKHPVVKSHPGKAKAAMELAQRYGLPDVSRLLRDLNEARKSEAYGDVTFPTNLSAEQVVDDVEKYVGAVEALLTR